MTFDWNILKWQGPLLTLLSFKFKVTSPDTTYTRYGPIYLTQNLQQTKKKNNPHNNFVVAVVRDDQIKCAKRHFETLRFSYAVWRKDKLHSDRKKRKWEEEWTRSTMPILCQRTKAYHRKNLVYDSIIFTANKINFVSFLCLILGLDVWTFPMGGTGSVIPFKGACVLKWGAPLTGVIKYANRLLFCPIVVFILK